LLVGLVQAGERHRFQLQAVLFQIFGYGVLYRLHEVTAHVLQVLDRHGGSGGAQRIHKLVFHQRFELFRAHGAGTQRLRCGTDGFFGLLDAHKEGRCYIDTHAVFGNQAFLTLAQYFQLQRVHVYQYTLVKHR